MHKFKVPNAPPTQEALDRVTEYFNTLKATRGDDYSDIVNMYAQVAITVCGISPMERVLSPSLDMMQTNCIQLMTTCSKLSGISTQELMDAVDEVFEAYGFERVEEEKQS